MNIMQMLVPDSIIFPNSDGYTRKWLVIHKTGGGSTAQETAQYFQNGAPQADGTFARTSVHYVVGLDGAIVQCVRESDGAGGNCCLEAGHDTFWPTDINLNLVTFSIECVDPAQDNSTPMPTAQKQSLFWLVKDLCARQNIPIQPANADGGITGHRSIAPLTRAHCPGNFAWDEMWTYLNEWKHLKNGGTMIPAGWHDNAQTGVLTAPNGITVVRGFRDYILANNWDANNLPLQVEQPMNPLELSNPGLGGGTQQVFRWSVLEWTADRGVFVSWVGQELLATRKALHDAYAQIATLQQQENTQLLKQIADYTNRFNQIGQLASQVAQLVKIPQA